MVVAAEVEPEPEPAAPEPEPEELTEPAEKPEPQPEPFAWWKKSNVDRGTFDLDNLKVGRLADNRLPIRFYWKNAQQDNITKNGYIGIVLVDTLQQKLYSYPRRFLNNPGQPEPSIVYDGGERFSIRRFKIVNVNVFAYSQPQQMIIFGYNQLGELLFRKRYDL